MVNKDTEAYLLKRLKGSLTLYCPKVIWVDRLQSGVVNNGKSWIHMCQPGTPDLYALVDIDGGQLVFIECKGPKGRQSEDQKKFEYMVKRFDNIHYVLAKDVNTVVKYINNLPEKRKEQ